jgi:hypothetical protein
LRACWFGVLRVDHDKVPAVTRSSAT